VVPFANWLAVTSSAIRKNALISLEKIEFVLQTSAYASCKARSTSVQINAPATEGANGMRRRLPSVIWLLTQPSLAATACTLENTASRTCEDGVVQAPAPARLIEGRPADRGHGRPGSGVQICRAGLVKNALAMLPRPVGRLTLIIAILRGKIYPPWPPSARKVLQSSNAFKSAASRVNHSPPARLLEARRETEPRFDSHSVSAIIVAAANGFRYPGFPRQMN
jgi:hypothetical protein